MELLPFIAATVTLALMPGPDILLVLTESIAKGKEYGIALAAGLCSGVLVHTTAAALGLSLLIQQSDWLFYLLKYMGAAYFLYLAYMAYRSPTALDWGQVSTTDLLQLSRKGFFMNVLNPKVSIFFIAFLPQFVNKESELAVVWQMIILGIIFMCVSFLIFAAVALLAGQLSPLLRQARYQNIIRYIKTAVLLVLGVLLLL